MTPDTFSFLLMALGSVLILVVGYIASLVIRRHNLKKDLELIEQLSKER